ncbi:MAG TPA: type IV pilus secretin PilQ [Candidatus Acidoferrales bacterium]|nr:type IV pilus secretin PilQ [Candidatus Acidoferrales bacterium]
MRIMPRAWGLGALIAAGLILSGGALRASDTPVVHVKAVVQDGGVRLEAEANGPFEYTTYRPSESLYVLDLSGVSAADPAGARVVASDLVKSYRVMSYSAGEKPVVRVEILLTQGVEPRLERKGSDDLTLLVSRTSHSASKPAASSPALVPASTKSSDSKAGAASFEAIRQVHLAQNGDATEVSISGSGPLTYHSLHLQNPDRLVLDFAGSHLTTSEKQIASNLDPVREIRLAQFTPEVSRVVIDLRQPAIYNIKTDGSTVTVSFTTKSSAGATSAPAGDSATVLTIKSQATPRANSGEEVAVARPAVIPAPPAVLPAALTQSSSGLATPAAPEAQQEETVAATRAALEPSAAASAAVPSAEAAAPAMPATQPAAAPANPARAQAPAAPPATGKYSGEPISVNLKDVDLRDFFRLIHEISGLNVVVDPGVKGNLTIVLDDVPWDQALDIVLKNNALDKQLEGNVLRLATKETLRKEAEQNRDLAKAQAEAADVVTTTRVLSYAKATDMATTLKKFLSSRGDIIADDRSNTLIIRDIPSTLPVMDNLLRQLDRKSQQVEIEARVVAANRSFSREIGSQFGMSTAFPTGGGTSGISGAPGVGPSPTTFTPAPPVVISSGSTTSSTSGQLPMNTNLGVGSPTSGFQYLYASKNFALDFVISAAESRGVGKLLSKPKVITQNNEKATVKQGTKIPVQTIVNNTVSVQFVDAVLELDVTPQITAEGTVYMDVTVENDQIDQAIPRVQGIPAIDTQSAQTKVTVDDGATVVIGGIIVTTQRTAIDQVPFVGSVPLLGNLFKHTTVSSSSQELLFFLTPRILPS